jgi:hypothetical protein
MSVLLKNMLFPYMAPASDADGGGGDAVDRGDDFTPTDDATDGAAKAAADKLAADAKAAEDKAAEDKAAEDKAAADAAALAEDEDADLTDEEKAEKADKAEKAAASKTKDTRIPLARHKDIIAKAHAERDALAAQLAKYQGGEKVAETNTKIAESETALVEMEKEHAQLVVDGKHADAAAKMTAIRKMEREITAAQGDMKLAAAEARAYERVRYDTAIERVEAAYPVLDKDHADYDEAKEAEVVELMAAYRTMGHTPTDALQKAAKTLLGVATAKQEKATEVKPSVDKDEVKEAAAKALAAERKAAQLKKNLDTKQPADLKNVGVDSDKAGGGPLSGEAVIKMPFDKFVKVDEETLSRLRGDVIA